MAGSPQDAMTIDWKFFVTSIGVIASILWNYVNWTRTSKVENTAFKSKQWEDVKRPILSALETFMRETSLASKMPMLVISDDLVIAKLNEYSQSIALAHDELSRNLSEADRTRYANGNDWESLAEGVRHDDSSWDKIVAWLAEVQEFPDRLQVRMDLFSRH